MYHCGACILLWPVNFEVFATRLVFWRACVRWIPGTLLQKVSTSHLGVQPVAQLPTFLILLQTWGRVCTLKISLTPTPAPKHIAQTEHNSPPPPFAAVAILLRMIQGLGESSSPGEVGRFFHDGSSANSDCWWNCHLGDCTGNSQIIFLKQRFWLSMWSLMHH